MATEIAPLDRAQRRDAATLLASRHAGDRRRAWDLPARYEDPEAALELIDALLDSPNATGMIAYGDGRPAGFLAALLRTPSQLTPGAKFVRPRSAIVPYHGHALADRDDGELYRELYAALAEVCVDRGYFSHYIEIPALDYTATDAFSSLGFGRQTTLALRAVAEPVEIPEPAGIEIGRAGPSDVEAIMRLSEVLGRHHASSPSFLPYLREPDTQIEKDTRAWLNEWSNALLLASRSGSVVGMQTYVAPASLSPLAVLAESTTYLFEGVVVPEGQRKGVGTALLREGMQWAESSGLKTCALHFLSANLAAARFWQSHGFWPLTHTLTRHVDERIAWANR
jgi:GNAT superfamily N-acetyltransferase